MNNKKYQYKGDPNFQTNKEFADAVQLALKETKEKIKQFTDAVEKTPLKEKIPEIQAMFRNLLVGRPVQGIFNFLEFVDQLTELLPYIERQINANEFKDRRKPKETDVQPFLEIFQEIVRRAEILSTAKKLPGSRRPDSLPWRLDPLRGIGADLVETITKKTVKAEKSDGKSDEINISQTFDFSSIPNVKMSRKITPFTELVADAIAAKIDAGNEYVTFSEIYETLNFGRPGSRDLQKIRNEVETMIKCITTIDNTQEVEHGYKYPPFKLTAQYLHADIMDEYAEIHGQLVNGYVKLYDIPLNHKFARTRKQYARLPADVHKSKVNKNPNTLRIEAYLLTRIQHARVGYQDPVIVLKTLYETLHIVGYTPQKRARNYIREFMDHFTRTTPPIISKYTMTTKEIKFTFPKTPKTTEDNQ